MKQLWGKVEFFSAKYIITVDLRQHAIFSEWSQQISVVLYAFNVILRVFTSATHATAKTLTQAGHVAPKFWVLDIRT